MPPRLTLLQLGGKLDLTVTGDDLITPCLFVDGIVRPVFLDDGGNQYVIDADGHTATVELPWAGRWGRCPRNGDYLSG